MRVAPSTFQVVYLREESMPVSPWLLVKRAPLTSGNGIAVKWHMKRSWIQGKFPGQRQVIQQPGFQVLDHFSFLDSFRWYVIGSMEFQGIVLKRPLMMFLHFGSISYSSSSPRNQKLHFSKTWWNWWPAYGGTMFLVYLVLLLLSLSHLYYI